MAPFRGVIYLSDKMAHDFNVVQEFACKYNALVMHSGLFGMLTLDNLLQRLDRGTVFDGDGQRLVERR